MAVQVSLEHNDIAPTTETGSGVLAFAPDLAYLRLSIVNVVFYGNPTKGDGWVLIDAGLPTSKGSIIDAAEHRFGRNHVYVLTNFRCCRGILRSRVGLDSCCREQKKDPRRRGSACDGSYVGET
jgi:hypothetical protein